jgi:hypothetical protein
MAGQQRAYEELRSGIEQLGGSMIWERSGYRYGAWIVTLNGKQRIFRAEGRHCFLDFDPLYVPKVPNPRENWDDYSNELVDGAIDKLVAMLV